MLASTTFRWGLLAVLGLGGMAMAVHLHQEPAPEPVAFEIDIGALKAGDLVFRRGQGLTSRMVLAADRGSVYSHVGLVYPSADGPRVIHAIPGADFESPMPLQIESLAAFTDAGVASALTIRRLEVAYAAYAERAAALAFSYARDSVLFDADFDLQSRDRMYCTELVWHAYREAGLDLVDGVFDELAIPFANGPYILPSSLLGSPYLTEVLSLTHNPDDRHD